MTTVARLLQEKGNAVWSIEPGCTVYEALQLMAKREVGALVVLEGRRVVGIISERDYARKVVLKGKSSKTTAVREIMTDKVYYVSPEQTAEDCMALMTAKRARHLPVMVEDRVVGIISIGDVVRSVISEKEFIIQELEKYITGDR